MTMVIYKVVAGKLPDRPPGPNKWLSDGIWNFISRCWSLSRDGRPDIRLAMDTLIAAADAVGRLRGFRGLRIVNCP